MALPRLSLERGRYLAAIPQSGLPFYYMGTIMTTSPLDGQWTTGEETHAAYIALLDTASEKGFNRAQTTAAALLLVVAQVTGREWPPELLIQYIQEMTGITGMYFAIQARKEATPEEPVIDEDDELLKMPPVGRVN